MSIMGISYPPYHLGISQGFSIEGIIKEALSAEPINVALLLIAGVIAYLYWIEKKRTKIHQLRNFINQLAIRLRLVERRVGISYEDDDEEAIAALVEKLDANRDRRKRSDE